MSQDKVFDYLKSRGIPTDVSVIAKALGISKSTTHQNLTRLEEQGFVERERVRVGRYHYVVWRTS